MKKNPPSCSANIIENIYDLQIKTVKAAGIILFDDKEFKNFLLMKHKNRYDLPKGGVKKGETMLESAKREFREETGIHLQKIKFIRNFQWIHTYFFIDKKNGKLTQKHLSIYLAHLKEPSEIIPSEHTGYEWRPWDPPHSIQENTIDALLHELDKYFIYINKL